MKLFYSNKKLFLVFGISVLFSVIFLFFFKGLGPAEHAEPGTDYFVYYEPIACNILEGRGVVADSGKMPLNIGPVFPIYLSGIFLLSKISGADRFLLIILANVLISAFSSCILFLAAKNMFGARIGLISAFLWSSYPFNLWFLKNPNTEILFILFFFSGVLFYLLSVKKERVIYAFLAGFFVSMATGVRLITLFLPVLFVLLFFIFFKNKKPLFFSFAMIIGCLAVFGPWAGYSYYVNKEFISISEQGPKNIISGVNWLSEPGKRDIISEGALSLIDKMNRQNLDTFGKTAKFFIRETIQRPGPILEIAWLKFSRSWYGTSSRWREEPLVLLVQLFYMITAVFGLKLALKENKNNIIFIVLPAAIILFFWGMTFLAVSIMRYMIPAMALVIVFSAISISKLIEKFYAAFCFNNNTLQK